MKVAVITSDHARESGPWSGSHCILGRLRHYLLVAGAWDCSNQRAHARHRLSARPNELPVLLEPSGRRAGVSLHERNRLEPAPFEHPEDPGPNRTPRNAGRCDHGKQFYVRFEDRLFRMATGPIRLAQMLDTELVPVLIVETSTWKYTIHFGTPVPQHYLVNQPDMQAIGTHLLQEFSKVITRYPEQCNMRLLRAMFPLPENGVADLSAVVHAAESR